MDYKKLKGKSGYDLLQAIGKTEGDVIEQIKTEYTFSEEYIIPKLNKFRDRIKLISNIADGDKIRDHTIYSTMNALLSLYYTDEITIEFSGRKESDKDKADNLENLAKFDFDEMGLEKINYQKQRDRLFYGIGIRVLDGWDIKRQCPRIKIVDPVCYRPDPNLTLNIEPTFHGFLFVEHKSNLKEEYGYFNIDQIGDKKDTEFYNRDIQDSERARTRMYSYQYGRTVSDQIDIYHHYMIIDGRKYLATLANARTLLIRFEYIEPILTEEKENEMLVPFPVNVTRYEPLRGDPFGMSIPDLLENPQKYKTQFAQLMYKSAARQALGGDYLVDRAANINKADLAKPHIGVKYISYEGGRTANPIIPLNNFDRITNDVRQFQQYLDSNAYLALGMDARALGVSPGGGVTKAENQRVQQNQNLKIGLKIKIDMRGERDFWYRLRYRAYKQFFPFNGKKNLVLNTAIGNIPYTIKEKDFLTIQDVNIEIKSKTEQDAERLEKLGKIQPLLPMIMQDPETPTITKKFYMRKYIELSGFSKEDAYIAAPETPDELKANEMVRLINRNEMPDLPTDFNNTDWVTYMIIIIRALDTTAKYATLEAIKEMVKQSGKGKQEGNQAQQDAIMNMGAAQMSGAGLRQTEQQASNLQNLTI